MPVSIAHATLAQSFFTLVVCLAYFTSREWKEPAQSISAPASHRRIFLVMAGLVYLQLILGALVRHSGSALAIPDFPLAQGRLIPEFTSPQIAIQFIHRLGAVAILIWSIYTARFVFKNYRESRYFVRPAIFLISLVCLQILVGGWTVLSKTAVPVATAHVAIGALTLATSVVLCIRSFRHLEVANTANAIAVPGYKAS
jgi:cytochrome c oxidase assembly protein subunit 15